MSKPPEDDETVRLSPDDGHDKNIAREGKLEEERSNDELLDVTIKEIPGAEDIRSTFDIKYGATDPAPLGSSASTNLDNKPLSSQELFNNRYLLIEKLGEGGMGMVHKAEDIVLNRVVAIKVLKLFGHNKDEQCARFHQEAQALARLNNKFIISVHDFGASSNDEPYIVFEFVDGYSLSKILKNYRKRDELLPLERVLDIAIQACSSLQCLHDDKIIHRDIKPGNMMLEKKRQSETVAITLGDGLIERDTALHGTVKLVDFGLAKIRDVDDNTRQKITRQGQAVGTLLYMSPEQCHGERVDGRSDIYSLGCVLFEMLCGQVPFRGEEVLETMNLHANGPIPSVRNVRPDLPFGEEFDRVLTKMLAKAREDRYQSADEVRKDLEAILRQIGPGIITGARYASITNTPYLQGPNSAVSHSQTIDKTVLIDNTQKITGHSLGTTTAEIETLQQSRFFGGLTRRQTKRFSILLIGVLVATLVFVPIIYANALGVSVFLLPEIMKTSWKHYDQKAQNKFNTCGNEEGLQSVEPLLLRALAKAKMEQGGLADLHLRTTLRELRILYYALKDKEKYARVDKEIALLPEQTKAERRSDAQTRCEKFIRTLNELNSRIDSNNANPMKPNQQDKMIQQSISLSYDSIDPVGFLSDVRHKLKGLGVAEGDLMSIAVVEEYRRHAAKMESTKYGEEALRKMKDDRGVTDPMTCYALGWLCLEQDLLDEAEEFAKRAANSPRASLRVKSKAQELLSGIQWGKGRSDYSIALMEDVLNKVQSSLPRNFTRIAHILESLGQKYVANKQPEMAYGPLIRSSAIVSCESESIVSKKPRNFGQ